MAEVVGILVLHLQKCINRIVILRDGCNSKGSYYVCNGANCTSVMLEKSN